MIYKIKLLWYLVVGIISRDSLLINSFFFLFLSVSLQSFAQSGGPPMLTHGTGTPGNKNWEINTSLKIIIPAIAVLTLIGCAHTSFPDNKATSIPLSAEYISTRDTTINFENGEMDKLPNGFTQTATGKLQTLNWKIVTDNGNKVVAQTAKNEGDYYNLLVLDKPRYENFSLSVKIKAVAGEEDQGGGLVWRYIDNNNYYVARCNPLENNFRFFKVVNGNRKQLKSVECSIKTGEWFSMSIEMNDSKISCSLNGNKMIDETDDTYTKAGRIGLWSKADAQSYFDDLTISPIK